MEMLRSDVYKKKLAGFIVDEAHCVACVFVCRGEDFRVKFFQFHSTVNVMALTATALYDVMYVMYSGPHIVTVSPDKSNVILRIESCTKMHLNL